MEQVTRAYMHEINFLKEGIRYLNNNYICKG